MPKMREFRDYLRYAHKCLSLAEEKIENGENAEWLLIPAITLAWSAIESFVNNRCFDLSTLPDKMFELHERAFLLERRLRFQDRGENLGTFILEGSEYQTLENKIFFLLSKTGTRKTTNLKGGELWQRFIHFKDVRDSLVHPRRDREVELKVIDVAEYIETAKELIQVISVRIWKVKVKL